MSKAEERFAALLASAGVEPPVSEFRFHPTRRWRFDFAWPAKRVAVEIEGGAWSGGRHTRGSGFIADCDKYNAATLLGWRVLRFTPQHLTRESEVIQMISTALAPPTCHAF